MAEQRALGGREIALGGSSAPVAFVLTSIAWREAWKYGDRAYRYCLHDIGHSWQSLALAAQAMGCETYATGGFPDDKVAQACRLNADEWPMLLIELRGATVPLRQPDARETIWYGGDANQTITFSWDITTISTGQTTQVVPGILVVAAAFKRVTRVGDSALVLAHLARSQLGLGKSFA